MIPKTRKEAFKVLGLSENASEQSIKKAYRKLALEWHPDKWSDKSQEEQKTATEKFKEILEAYKILTGKTEEELKEELGEMLKDLHKGATRLFYGLHLSEKEIELFEALHNKDLEQTKILLEQVQNINAQTMVCNKIFHKSILHYIVENSCNNPGWMELLEEVLSKYGANNIIDLNIISMLSGSPLNLACELGDLDVANVLLKYGAEPDARILYCVLMNSKNDAAKVLFEHGTKIDVNPKVEKLIIDGITGYSQSTVEILLPYTSNRQKSRMLQSIACSDHEETDHDIEKAKLLLKADGDPEFCGETEKGESTASASSWAKLKGKSELVKLFNEHKENIINNNPHLVKKQGVQSHITDHNSPQKQSSGISLRGWAIIGSALLFGAIGATLAAMGIIPEIAAIGMIATAVLSGIAGAIVGVVAEYLTDVVINQCCGNQQCATQ